MAGSLGTIVAELALNAAGFLQGLSKAEHQAKEFGKSFDRAIGEASRSLTSFVAGVAGAAAVVQQFRAALDYTTTIDKLAKQTGLAAESLDRLGIIAKQNDTDVRGLARVYKELGESMVKSTAEGTKEQQIFAALGISAVDSSGKMRSMDAVMRDLAAVFSKSKSGAEQMAVAAALFGKQGVELLPVLKNWAAEQERATLVQQSFGAVTDEVREGADNFGDALTLLGEGVQRGFYPVIESMGNALMRVATEFINVGKNGSALSPVFEAIKELGTAAVETLGALAIAANSLITSAGTAIGGFFAAIGLALKGDFSGAVTAFKESFSDAGRILDESSAAIARVMNRTQEATPVIKESADATDKMGKAAAAAAKTTNSLSDAKRKEADRLKAYLDLYKQALAAAEEEEKVIQAEIDASLKLADSLSDMVEQYRVEADQVGKTAEQIALSNNERARTKALVDVTNPAIRDSINAYFDEAEALIKLRYAREGDIDAAKKHAESITETQRLIEQFGDKAVDVFADVLHGGRDAFTRLADTIKTTVLRLIAQLTIKPIVVRLVASFLGASPGGAGAGGGDLISSLLGGGGNLLSGLGGLSNLGSLFGAGGISGLFSGAGGIFGAGGLLNSFALGSFGQTLGLSAVGLDMAGGVALTSLGATLGAVLPVLGIALAAATAFGLFDSGGGPKSGGFAQTSGLDLERFFTPNDQDSALQGLVDSIQENFARTLQALGGTGKGEFALGLDTDPEGTANNRLVSQAFVNGKLVYDYKSGDESLGRDADALKAALDLEAKRAFLAALQASDLPEAVSSVLNSLTASSATADEIENIVKTATAVKGIIDVLARDPLADLQQILEANAGGPLYALGKMGEALRNLMDEFDGSAESTEALATATASYYDAQLQLLAQLESLRQSLTGPEGLFASTRDQLTYQTLDDQGKYEFLQAQALRYQQLLSTATDPEDIDRYARMANDALVAAFNLLSPEEQARKLNEFLAGIDQLDSLTSERLDDVQETVTSSVQTVMEEVRTLLDNIADKMDGSADKTLAASDKMLLAANTPQKVDVVVTIDDGGEVNA